MSSVGKSGSPVEADETGHATVNWTIHANDNANVSMAGHTISDSISGNSVPMSYNSSGIHVVDTTGAGDIFGGSAMSQFLQYKKSPSDLTEEELTQIVRFACTAASLSTQKHGGITSVPDKQEVLDRLRV